MRRTPFVLAVLALAGAAAASAATLFWEGSFPPSSPTAVNTVLAEARGWSAVTLFGAVPCGIAALRSARRGSLRGRLGSAGILAYLVYTYLEMAVSPPFSALYLVYVATLALALPALIMTVAAVDIASLPRRTFPRRAVAVFSLLVAAGLALAWLKDILTRSIRGDFGWPQGPDAVGHVVQALDLGLLVPLGCATGLLLLRDHPAGVLFAAIQLAIGVLMGAALTAMVLCAEGSVAAAAPFAGLWLAWLALAIRAAKRLPSA